MTEHDDARAMGATILHEHGYVHLLDTMPSASNHGDSPSPEQSLDLRIVQAARTSFRHTTDTELTPARVRGLLNYLMRDGHGSPFEAVVFQFLIRAQKFVTIQILRHRTSSFNEESQRYKEPVDQAYVPAVNYCRTQVGKPGSYSYEQMDAEEALTARTIIAATNDNAFAAYQALLDIGVAKELARTVLPMGQFSTIMVTMNLRGVLNFLALRNDEHTQRETRDYAAAIEEIVTRHCPITMELFNEHGRRKP